MEIEGCVALVTGANRGLGKAYCEALLAAGAAKIYAGARDPSAITDPRLVPVRLDVTAPADIAAAAARCGDLTVLINNAGAMLLSPMLAEGSEAALRRELEVNVFGVLGMIRAFAPILGRNGGGAIANILSVVSWFTAPFNATYCASKHAALAVTDGARIQLREQGTQVLGIYAGFIDTDMAASVAEAKTSPRQVADRTLDGIRRGLDHVRADDSAEAIWQALKTDPAEFEAELQAQWHSGSPWQAA
jgi:NAD(P)-dependent dehydrogenase (short-subunit alcohol dehydrogenase family)